MSQSEISLFIVEDDASIRFGLEEVLTGAGYLVNSCADGADALKEIATLLPDLLVLDVMLPGCRIPILMLTAKGQEIDKVVGLKAGADDYLTKPFGINELIARIEALLRRSLHWQGGSIHSTKEPSTAPIEVGRARIDRAGVGADELHR